MEAKAAQTIIENARKTCVAAREATPEPLRGFIMDLPQRKNLGTRERPEWISYDTPYMTVDGRVTWAQTEAHNDGASMSVNTQFDTVGDVIICTAMVITPRGNATGHAPVNVGGGGVDRTNPFENAETSAVGRALAFLGYGVYGTGIASADEVVDAQSRRNGAGVPDMTKPPAQERPRGQNIPPSEAQVKFIRTLAQEMHWRPAETDDFIRILDRSEASKAIGLMKDRIDPRPAGLLGGEDDEDDSEPGFNFDEASPVRAPVAATQERTKMDEATRKAFFADVGRLGRWKGCEEHIRSYIEGQKWGTPENPRTTAFLDHMQRQAVLSFVAQLDGPYWTELFGNDGEGWVNREWRNVCGWARTCKVEPWDLAVYLMHEFGDNAPEAKKPSDFPVDLIETIEASVKANGDILLGDIEDYVKALKTF